MTKVQVREHCREIMAVYPEPPFMEIPSGGGDGDGGFVCFICDRAMDRGEPSTCLSRLLETREGGDAKPSVVEAVASLQVCLACTLLSSHHRLEWAHKPKLIEIEIGGFYTYARWLANAVAQAKSDTRVQEELAGELLGGAQCLAIELDRATFLGGIYHGNALGIITDGQCQKCHQIIGLSKRRVMFEISVDTPRRDGMTRSNVWRLGAYCHECSKQLLPLYDRLW